MNECLFCKIIAGEIPSTKVYEDEHVYAFRDISPLADTHVLIVPKQHIQDIAHFEALDDGTLAKLFAAANKIAVQLGIKDGYRLVMNTGEDAGQTVFHLHIHLLGGEKLGLFGRA